MHTHFWPKNLNERNYLNIPNLSLEANIKMDPKEFMCNNMQFLHRAQERVPMAVNFEHVILGFVKVAEFLDSVHISL